MDVFVMSLILATFLCSLVAGFLFAYAIVAMPGIKSLSDREFLRAFQVMDMVIQNNQPLFMLVWVGSVLVLIIAAVLSFGRLEVEQGFIMFIAVLTYLLGVQVPTATINIPLNNQVQTLNVDVLDEAANKEARTIFEARWNRWNRIRTIFSSLTSILLIFLISSL